MRLAKHFILTIIILIINSCTFYSLKGTIPVHIKNIYISPIVNKSMDQEVADLLDDKLNQLTIDQNVLEVVNYDTADSKLDIIVTEVIDMPYTLSQGDQFEKVDEWKLVIKANVIWSDFHKGELLFNVSINEWGIYGDSIDISNDGIDNDGDGFIDSEDSDEVGAPRDAAKLIAINKIGEKISTKIISTW